MAAHNLSDKIEFGKYKGKSVAHIAKCNPFYLDWCIRNVDDFWLYSRTFTNVLNITTKRFSFSKEACRKNSLKLQKGNGGSASRRSSSKTEGYSKRSGEYADWNYDRYNPAHDSGQNVWIDVLGAGVEAETAYWNTE
jgi:hypothetical protein